MKFLPVVLIFVLLVPLALGHEEEIHDTQTESFFHNIENREFAVVGWGSVIITAIVILSVLLKRGNNLSKKVFFMGILIISAGVTLYLGVDTVYTNITSETDGPVHWHTDYEIWNCGERLDLVDPEGFSNKIGTSIFHEHNDDRIHIEGPVEDLDDIGLDDYFRIIGGDLTSSSFIYPTNNGFVSVNNGDECNSSSGNLEIWLFRVKDPYQRSNWELEQTLLENPSEYIPAPFGNIPPGDCVIIEFDNEPGTDKLCAFWASAIERGELYGFERGDFAAR